MKKIIYLTLGCIGFMFFGCETFLDKKSDMSLTVIDSPDDLLALMDNVPRMNRAAVVLQNASDEFYLTEADWRSMPNIFNRESYIWDPRTQNDEDWNALYQVVNIANVVLDNLGEIGLHDTDSQFMSLRGMALFHRSHAYYQLLQVFSKQYDPLTADADLGIVLRANSDFSDKSERAKIAECYHQVIDDLLLASSLLDPLPLYRTRPSQWACEALLARLYLTMGRFADAEEHALKCLSIRDQLLDYNIFPQNALPPFALLNDEVIFYSNTSVSITAQPVRALIPFEFYQQYEEGDLRKILFFDTRNMERITFKGSYNGTVSNIFNGIGIDEVYLILAESRIHLGRLESGLEVLNKLRSFRWDSDQFSPFIVDSKDECLKIVKQEREKQLLYRGLRVIDYRRWSKSEPELMMKRNIGDDKFVLDFTKEELVWKIPDQVLNQVDLPQN